MRLDVRILESPAIFHISKILDITGVFPQKPSEFRDNDCSCCSKIRNFHRKFFILVHSTESYVLTKKNYTGSRASRNFLKIACAHDLSHST